MCARLTIPLLILALLLASGLGCGGIKPGSDPVVVNAERAEEVSLAAIDVFLKVEADNHDFFKAKAPAVTKAANDLRREVPVAWRDYRTALDAYRATKAPAERTAL